MVTGAAYYQSVLDAIYSAITGLDATPYRVDATSVWTRGRRMTGPGGAGTRELEVLVDLGTATGFKRSEITHQITIGWPMRYRASSEEAGGINDQSRFHASARAVSEALAFLRPAEGSRVVPTGWQMMRPPVGDEWVIVELTATLTLLRGA